MAGPQGLPLLKPPYGMIVAIDLNRGEIAWRVPNGEGPRFVGEGDPVAAATPPGGGGTKFRPYDKATGAVL